MYTGSTLWLMSTMTSPNLLTNNTPSLWSKHEITCLDRQNNSLGCLSDQGSRNWGWLGLIVIPLWMLSGNILVLLSVWLHRRLRTLSNWVIASLAFTDFLLSVTVVPLGLYQLVSSSPRAFLCNSLNSFRSSDAFLQLLRLVIDAFSQLFHSHSDALWRSSH